MNEQLQPSFDDDSVPQPVKKLDADSIPGARKAAMLLISLGDLASAKILSHLSEDEVQKVTKEVARVRSVSSVELESVLEEFHNLMLATDYVVSGGLDYARKMLVAAFGQEDGTRLLEKLPKDLGRPSSFRSLQKVDAKQL